MSRVRRLAGAGLRALPPVQGFVYRRRARREAARIDPARPRAVPVLVYTMGKVGSATVERSLDGCNRRVVSVHYLVPEEIEASKAWRLRVGGDRRTVYVLALGEAIGARIAELGDRVRFPVVTLVRDPIAREVSGVFQSADLLRRVLRDDHGAIDVDAALELISERFAGADPCGYVEEWFDRELLKTFGVDVFATPFDFARGYTILHGERADVLVLRTEHLDRSLPPGVAELLRLPEGPRVRRANERDLSRDGAAYAQVRKALRFPRAVVERIYAGRVARHFYTEEEIARFVQRWT